MSSHHTALELGAGYVQCASVGADYVTLHQVPAMRLWVVSATQDGSVRGSESYTSLTKARSAFARTARALRRYESVDGVL